MAKITQYPAKTVPSNNDEFVLHDPSSGSTKKMTRGDLIGGGPLPADSVDEQALDFATLNFGNYSTSEVNTGFTWTDGRPIFKRTFIGTYTHTANTDANVSVVSSSAYDYVIKAEGEVQVDTSMMGLNSTQFTINSFSVYRFNQFVSDTGQLRVRTQSSTSGSRTYRITLYYVK